MVLPESEEYQRIHVRRSSIYSDALRQFSKFSFDASKPLKVIFIGEQAVDEGGPRREFFRLILQEAFSKSGLFAGWPDHVVPLHNIEALSHNKFYVIGKMVATCLVQGGQPPVCFARAVAEFLVNESVETPVCMEDIPDYETRQRLIEV